MRRHARNHDQTAPSHAVELTIGTSTCWRADFQYQNVLQDLLALWVNSVPQAAVRPEWAEAIALQQPAKRESIASSSGGMPTHPNIVETEAEASPDADASEPRLAFFATSRAWSKACCAS